MSEALRWQKGSRSDGGGNCVEVSKDLDGAVWVRNSNDPNGPVISFTRAEWTAFTGSVQDGELGYDTL